jgi:hypothetical protein
MSRQPTGAYMYQNVGIGTTCSTDHMLWTGPSGTTVGFGFWSDDVTTGTTAYTDNNW